MLASEWLLVATSRRVKMGYGSCESTVRSVQEVRKSQIIIIVIIVIVVILCLLSDA